MTKEPPAILRFITVKRETFYILIGITLFNVYQSRRMRAKQPVLRTCIICVPVPSALFRFSLSCPSRSFLGVLRLLEGSGWRPTLPSSKGSSLLHATDATNSRSDACVRYPLSPVLGVTGWVRGARPSGQCGQQVEDLIIERKQHPKSHRVNIAPLHNIHTIVGTAQDSGIFLISAQKRKSC